jgi:hypothetical protein
MIFKNLQKSTLAFNGGSNSEMHHFLCQTEFHLVLTPSFIFPERLNCCYIYFHCFYMYNYYNYLEPCALNAEFQHLIYKFITSVRPSVRPVTLCVVTGPEPEPLWTWNPSVCDHRTQRKVTGKR